MYFRHDPAVWADFPSLVAGVSVVTGIRPDRPVEPFIEPLFARARERLAGRTESDLPEVQAWRRAFSQMGFKPTQYRSAGEALLRRFRKEDTLPRLHPLVDLYNAASLAYSLPVGAFDLDQIAEWMEVRYADGDELYSAFSGEQEHPVPGEVIFADAARHVHARRWTFRQGRQSTVSEATTRALLVCEGLHASAASDVPALMATLTDALAQAGFGVTPPQVLSASAPTFVID